MLIHNRSKHFSTVADYYLSECRALAEGGKDKIILKSDGFNEANDLPVIFGIVGSIGGRHEWRIVEYDSATAIKARKNLSEIKQWMESCDVFIGDIRRLPYERDFFDLVFDLSTIDHIHPTDMERVIREYARVLRPAGKALIFVWFNNSKGDVIDNSEWNPGKQYYFLQKDFEAAINLHFKTLEKGMVVSQLNIENKPIELWQYILKSQK